MGSVFSPRAPAYAAINGTAETFPIGRIYCIGRNYAAHAREMGRDPEREPPFFFLKDADAFVPDGAVIGYPPETKNYHHEVELVVAIGKAGFRVPATEVAPMIFGYAVGLDMTRRDLQLAAREQGRPWCAGKNFPFSAPMGRINRAQDTGLLTAGEIKLTVNGDVRQVSDIGKLIWSVGEVVEHLSRYYELRPGDLIFTGTPEGVGPVIPGDELVGTIDGLGSLKVTIAPPAGL